MLEHLKTGQQFRFAFVTPDQNKFGPWVNGHTKKVPFALADLELDQFEKIVCIIQGKVGSRIHNHFSYEIQPRVDRLEYRFMASGMLGTLNSRIVGMNIRQKNIFKLSFLFDEELQKWQ